MSVKLSSFVNNLIKPKKIQLLNFLRLMVTKVPSEKVNQDWNLENKYKLINLSKPKFYERIQEVNFKDKSLEEKQKVFAFLNKILKCKTQEELSMYIKANPNLLQINIENSRQNVNILNALDLTDFISHHSWLLLLPSAHLDKLKQILIQEANLSLVIHFTPEMIPLLAIPPLKFKNYLRQIYSQPLNCSQIMNAFNERVNYISQELEMSNKYILSKFIDHPILIVGDYDLIKAKMILFKSAGLTPAAIVNDLWAFNHDINLIKERVDQMIKLKYPAKTWMLRCPKSVFEEHMKIWQKKVNILGENKTVASYFANKLGVDIKEVYELNERDRKILAVNLFKLEKIINFLLEQGFKGEEIFRNNRLLTFAFRKIKTRIEELKAISNEKIILRNIIKPNKSYGEYYRQRRDRAGRN